MRESEETTPKRATGGDPVDREAGEATSRSRPERGARARRIAAAGVVALLCVAGWVAGNAATAGPYTVIAWNDLGMHCVDGTDFSVFSLLPPYNNIHAQLTRKDGVDVDPASVRVTYEAIPDANGSVNTTSVGKTNFWTFVNALFGVTLPPDAGLAGYAMPGASNTPRTMAWDASKKWYSGEGIPITPYDDGGNKNYYPMFRVSVRDQSGNLLASTDIVLPVSDEMNCSSCHASGSKSGTQPSTGWAWNSDPNRDMRLNVLKLHDDKAASSPAYATALAQAGYRAGGLYETATVAGTPILCARCHLSNALPGSGYAGIPPLTQALHGAHASAVDPTNGMTLDASANRSACYRCHPGSETKCLRGAMGSAVAADGTLAMQCQGCHGTMSAVGSASRTGWLSEPACQQCHTGTATKNSGQIRYTSVFDSTGQPRVAADATFATNSNVPSAGFSLYRFSKGHGGLACEACHGSTHAEFPAHGNDNVQSLQLQGHVGMISECTTCHAQMPETTTGGPHGMHPLGSAWVDHHGDAAEHGLDGCKSCHGSDLHGTVLSRVLGDRTVSAGDFGTKTFWRGFQISCWACHNGPSSESATRNRPPTVKSASLSTSGGKAASLTFSASDPDRNTLTFRIVSQPLHGTVGLSGKTATFYPEAGYVGSDTFTFAAWDGSINSNLGTVKVTLSR